MNKFKFSLENALKFRKSIEDRDRELLARARQKVQQEEELSQKLDLEKHEHFRSYDIYTSNLTTMQQQESYLTGLDWRIKSQHIQLDKAKRASDTRRAQVVTATSNRKILERLKEKHLEEYKQELARSEQKILDEVGISSYCRKARN